MTCGVYSAESMLLAGAAALLSMVPQQRGNRVVAQQCGLPLLVFTVCAASVSPSSDPLPVLKAQYTDACQGNKLQEWGAQSVYTCKLS